ASYAMADSDTLASAEEQVLLRAKRKAVEQSGVYIETVFEDRETSRGETTSRLQSLGIRTIAAAVTETDILEKYRSLEAERPVFYVKIRATVHLDWLVEAIRRLKSDEQLADHHHQLHMEYRQIKAQLDRVRKQLQGRNGIQAGSAQALKDHRSARQWVRSAIQVHDLPDKIELASRAIDADDSYLDAYIIRGQTFLKVASLAHAKKEKQVEVINYVERAGADFDRALAVNPQSTWALLGRGDTSTWKRHAEDAAASYERILQIDPLFDLARQRLIALQTAVARKHIAAGRWREAVTTLEKLLRGESAQSWLAHQKEAYLLRSQAYQQLGESDRAVRDLTKVVGVDPTNAHAFLLRAKIYRHLKQEKLANEDFERACVLGVEEACTRTP
ncbi:MAG: tetratricopeptide repeat protein, partial [Nitrospiraceae bacterium]